VFHFILVSLCAVVAAFIVVYLVFNLFVTDMFANAHTFSKTLLKLTIPRIKLLRNRREIQLKNMRRDIAKLLETGQEATARIRVNLHMMFNFFSILVF